MPAPRKDPGPADDLSPEEQEQVRASDRADVSPRAASPKTSGPRIRAIPAVVTKSGQRSSRVEITRQNFADKGFDHPTVVFDFRTDNFTLPVGGDDGIDKEVADFLTKNYPTSFEYMNKE